MKPYWRNEEHDLTIYCGDSFELMASLPAASVDLVLTDPPYGLDYNNGDLAHLRENALGRGERGEARPIAGDGREDWLANMPRLMQEANRLLKPGCCCCCCCCGGGPQPIYAEMTLAMDEYIGFKQAVVWDKGGLGMGWHYRRSYEFVLVAQKKGAACNWQGSNAESNVVRIPKIIPTAEQHPCEKPVTLMQHFIGLHSRPGELVLEPYLGRGATLVAAFRKGRAAIGCDIDERWAEAAARRLEAELAQGRLFEPQEVAQPTQEAFALEAAE